MRLAIIPARGGSKRIPRKNILPFGGKPMIGWSIEAAYKSKCFDRIIVSTDDAEISMIAKKYGAEVPFIRPPELSDDHVGTIPVIKHAIEWINNNSIVVSEACCIYATAPFLQPGDIKNGLDQLIAGNADYAFSVTNYPFPIQRALRILPNNHVEMFNPEQFNTRSQDLEVAWHDAGQFYWGKSNSWLCEKKVFSSYSLPLILPRSRVQDIDTHEDWIHAELLFNSHILRNNLNSNYE